MQQGQTARRLPGRELTSERIAEALFAVAHRSLTLPEVAKFIGSPTAPSSEPYAAACLAVLQELRLVEIDEEGYKAVAAVGSDFRNLPKADRYTIFSRYAMKYKPFVEFIALVHKGYSPSEAATKTNVVYELGTKDRFVEKTMLELGVYAHLIRKVNGGYGLTVVVDELPADYIDRLREATRGEAQATLFIRERLGEKAFQYVGDEQVADFVHALLEFRKEPKDAIVAVGRASEDFLRKVAAERGKLDYGGCNGAVDLAKRMREEVPPLLLQGHFARASFVGGVRNPGGGHGLDKTTLERWSVSPEAALETILVGLSLVQSAFAYVFTQVQTL